MKVQEVQEATIVEQAESLAEFADAAFEMMHNLGAQTKVLQAEILLLQERVAALENGRVGDEWA